VTKPLGSVGAVVAAVQDEAEAAVEAIRAEAAARAASILREEQAAAPTDREARLAAARRQARERLAREDWEDSRAGLEQREAWIRRVTAEGLRRLAEAEPEARRQRLLALAADALSRLPGDRFELGLGDADLASMAEGDRRALAAERGAAEVRCVPDPAAVGGGCVARTAEGRATFDNTYPARARALERAWRSVLGALHGP
jgi:vacuolar-type H+-ATPase subunit E/Vma4